MVIEDETGELCPVVVADLQKETLHRYDHVLRLDLNKITKIYLQKECNELKIRRSDTKKTAYTP
jgi:hypothetical protein